MKVLIGSIISLALIMAIVIIGLNVSISSYNNIVKAYQRSEVNLGNLNSQYERRYALIDNFISIIKEIKEFEKFTMEFEKGVYLEVAKAKADATKLSLNYPDSIKEKISKEKNISDILTNFLGKITLLAQTYPQISDPTIKDHSQTISALKELKQDLSAIETDILMARQKFNESIGNYNINIHIFPANVIARLSSYKPINYFDNIDIKAKENAKISF